MRLWKWPGRELGRTREKLDEECVYWEFEIDGLVWVLEAIGYQFLHVYIYRLVVSKEFIPNN